MSDRTHLSHIVPSRPESLPSDLPCVPLDPPSSGISGWGSLAACIAWENILLPTCCSSASPVCGAELPQISKIVCGKNTIPLPCIFPPFVAKSHSNPSGITRRQRKRWERRDGHKGSWGAGFPAEAPCRETTALLEQRWLVKVQLLRTLQRGVGCRFIVLISRVLWP